MKSILVQLLSSAIDAILCSSCMHTVHNFVHQFKCKLLALEAQCSRVVSHLIHSAAKHIVSMYVSSWLTTLWYAANWLMILKHTCIKWLTTL